MTRRAPTNVAASVHRRLLDVIRNTGADPNDTFLRFALERFLYRLAISAHARLFMLKGATLFSVWEQNPHRATRDIDLLGFGDDSAGSLGSIFADVCRVAVPDDGMSFDPGSVVVSDIRGEHRALGKRVRLAARLGTAKFTVQVDIGFGDALTKEGAEVTLPTLLAA